MSVIWTSLVINAKARMVYRFDFWMAILMKGMETAISYLLLDFLILHIGAIGGFERPQIILIFGISELSFSIWHCFFINSLSVGRYVREGLLDRFMLRPIGLVSQILIDGFDEDGWGGLIVSAVVLGIAHSMGAGPHAMIGWMMLIAGAVCGAFVFFGISLLLSSLSVWAQTQSNLGLVLMDLRIFSRYPTTIYPSWLRAILSTMVPLSVCGYWPALVAEGDDLYFFYLVSVTIAFVTLSVLLFHWFVRRFYVGTGS